MYVRLPPSRCSLTHQFFSIAKKKKPKDLCGNDSKSPSTSQIIPLLRSALEKKKQSNLFKFNPKKKILALFFQGGNYVPSNTIDLSKGVSIISYRLPYTLQLVRSYAITSNSKAAQGLLRQVVLLLKFPPLRTVRATFIAYGSSIKLNIYTYILKKRILSTSATSKKRYIRESETSKAI